MDESGLTTAQNPNKIVAPRGKKQIGSITSQERGELVTFVGTISASGVSIPPLFIFPRAKYYDNFISGAPTGSIGCSGRSGSGWMTSAIYSGVYLPHFVKHAKCSTENPVLLILDNHESHVSLESITYAKANGIHMLTLPPHCSHQMQPLDRTIYGPMKTYYNRSMDMFMRSNVGKSVNIYDIPKIVEPAYHKAMTIDNISGGFRSTGIYPYDRDVFKECDFAAADVSERSLPASADPTPSAGVTNAVASSSVVYTYSTPSTSSVPDTIAGVSPADILPLPRYERKTASRGRKKRRSAIVTDTPEKEPVEHERMKAGPNLTKHRHTTVVVSSSDSDDGPDPVLSDHSSDENMDESEPEAVQQITKDMLEVGMFVLVEYTSKRSTCYYIAQLEGIADELLIDCLRRVGITNQFRKPDIKDPDLVDISRIKQIVIPTTEGLSRRALGGFSFVLDSRLDIR